MQPGGVGARQRGLHRLRDHRHRDAERFGALALHPQKGARRVHCQRGVDRDDVRGGGKGLGHLGRQTLAAGLVRAVDLGHQRADHRWAGRHLDQLELGAVAGGDLLQRRAQALGDRVALLVAVLLVDQVDLQVTLLGIGAQVVLAHQAVEGDRAGGAGVALQVQHLGLLGQEGRQVLQRSGGGL